jgi:hypothetical protein
MTCGKISLKTSSENLPHFFVAKINYMKLLLLLILISACACRVQKEHIEPQNYLTVFFMNSFRNDSMRLRTNANNDTSFGANTNTLLSQATSIDIRMTENDTMISVLDVNKQIADSIKYEKGKCCLYVFYQESKFTFEYTDKPLITE